jgi:hypothetical protein
MTAAVISAPLSWITPLAYAIYCGGPIDIHAITLWAWPALPSSSPMATLLAFVLLGAGVTSITNAGAHDRHADPG